MPTGHKIIANKRGTGFGFYFFRLLLKTVGLRGAYSFLYVVCLYYLLFDRQAVNGALAYAKRRFPACGFLGLRLQIYRLFLSQGKQLIDRFAAISGSKIFDVRVEGLEKISELLRQGQNGLVLLTAHIGNWQLALTTLRNLPRTVHLVMRPEDNPAVKHSLRIDEEDEAIRIISPETELGGVVPIMQALRNGDIVSIMGDRRYDFNAVNVSFLGEQAYFPYGAFAVAAAAGCPVVILLSARLACKRYLVDVTNVLYPRYDVSGNKKEQLRNFVQQFALTLETYAQRYPHQCFLFHDLWKN